MTGATVRRALTLAGITGTLLAAFALPASAHVAVTPARAAPGQLLLYTIQVPNELPDQDTVELDVTLPTGFTLDVAQALPGWQTVISKQAGLASRSPDVVDNLGSAGPLAGGLRHRCGRRRARARACAARADRPTPMDRSGATSHPVQHHASAAARAIAWSGRAGPWP
mgnify:CR=1 FL=1